MRGLASGAKGFEKFPKIMADKFVFLNVYCKSVKDEHKPRGPEGPYQFNDKSVPVCVVKLWDGTSVIQQLGFGPDPKLNLKQVARWMEKALKKNGPVLPPKKLRPLAKAFAKGKAYLDKKRPGYAWNEYAKVTKLGGNKKKFPAGPPRVAIEAKKEMDAIKTALEKALIDAQELSDNDEAKAKKLFSQIHRKYGSARDLKKLIIAAQKSE